MKHSRTFCVALLASVCCGLVHADGTPARFKLNIEPQPLGSALMAFGEQSGVQVLMKIEDGAVEKAKAPRLVGEFTAQGALDQMLRNSGLRYEFVNDRTVRVSSAEETAGAPATASWRVAQARGSSAAANASGSGQSAQQQENDPEPAQNSPGAKLEEIVVTAQKREQRLIDVPMSITAVTGEQLDRTRTKTLEDLGLSIPGLSFAEFSPGNKFIVIRGLGTQRGTSTLTGVYLDEVPMTIAQGPNANPDIPIQDLQRVEVLRGPQGTLFGEGSMGGTVRYVTKDPVLDRVEGSVDASYFATRDGDPSHELNGILNLPLVENVFGIRVAASYGNFGGWIDKVSGPGGSVLREDLNDSENKNVRIKSLWRPTDKLSISAMVIVNRLDVGGENQVNVDPFSQSHFQPAIDPSIDDALGSRQDIYNLTASYDLGFAQLLSSTSKYDVEVKTGLNQVFPGNPTFFGLPGSTPIPVEIRGWAGTRETSAFAQELRLASTDTDRLKWVTGGFYKDADTTGRPDEFAFDLPGIFAEPFQFPDGIPTVSTIRSWALFVDGSFDITDRLELGAGLRYAHETRFSRPVTPTPGTTSLTLRYKKYTYRAFASYKLNDRLRIYANTGTGFRAGGINDLASIALGAPTFFGPETLTSYELGAKGTFLDGRLNGSMAFYTSDWTDVQGATISITPPPENTVFSFLTNAGGARIKGVELTLDLQASESWKLGFNGDITHGRYTKIDAANPTPPVVIGDWTDFTPENSFSVYSEYVFNWSNDLSSLLRLDYNQQGKSRFTLREEVPYFPVNTAPVVGFVNVRLETLWHDWTLSVFSRNLLDETKPIQATTNNIYAQARRRTIGLTVGKSF